jgi:hypothetical protein
MNLELRPPMLFPAPLAPPRDVQEGMDKPPQPSLATNMNAEFTIFWVAADTAFLLSSGFSPHVRSHPHETRLPKHQKGLLLGHQSPGFSKIIFPFLEM